MGKYEKIYEYEKNADVPVWRKRICQLMNNNHITQQELANGCDISASVISDWIGTNKTSNAKLREPTITRFQKIAEFFGVSVDYLLGGNQCPTPDDEKIYELTGLSSGAIQQLRNLHNTESGDSTNEKRLRILNFLLENMEETAFLEDLHSYILGNFVFPGHEDDQIAIGMIERLPSGREKRKILLREVLAQAKLVSVQENLTELKKIAQKNLELSGK